jgi:chromosome segregation ATPase
MDPDIDAIFDELDATVVELDKPYDHSETVVERIEAEYRQIPDAIRERELEKSTLTKEMETLKRKIKSTKNVRNHRMVVANTAKSTARKEMKDRIEKIKDRLYEIELEEKGSGITSQNMVDATLKKK